MIDKKEFTKKWKNEYAEQMLKERYTLDWLGKRIKRECELNCLMHLVYNDIRGYPLNRGFEKISDELKISLNSYSFNRLICQFVKDMLGENIKEYENQFKQKITKWLNSID